MKIEIAKKYVVTESHDNGNDIFMVIPPGQIIEGEILKSFDDIESAMDFIAEQIERVTLVEHRDVEFHF